MAFSNTASGMRASGGKGTEGFTCTVEIIFIKIADTHWNILRMPEFNPALFFILKSGYP
jgi:hypothetical protein